MPLLILYALQFYSTTIVLVYCIIRHGPYTKLLLSILLLSYTFMSISYKSTRPSMLKYAFSIESHLF